MTLLSILCTMGLPAIDQSLDKLLVAMEAFPNVAILGDTISFARMLGPCPRPLHRLIRVLDDDARTPGDGCHEAAPNHRNLDVHILFVMDMLGSSGTRQVTRSYDKGHGYGEK